MYLFRKWHIPLLPFTVTTMSGDEYEIAGCSDVLNTIHEHHDDINQTVLLLHLGTGT